MAKKSGKRGATIKKAVFPVAGMGSRFLPATKASPKEMLPVVDKPLIQYAVEEAVAAGITQLIFVTGRNKRSIEDHFDKAYELEAELAARGKKELLKIAIDVIPPGVSCAYIRQSEALGLGHAVLTASHLIGNEPFVVILADDLIVGKPSVTEQMVNLYEYYKCSIIGVQDVPREEVSAYGVISPKGKVGELYQLGGIVEKPPADQAPSTLAVVGRYVFTPHIFELLSKVTPGAGGEIQLTDAIAAMVEEEQVLGYLFNGTRYDCGSKLGHLVANIEVGLEHKEVGPGLREYLGHKFGKALVK